MGSELGEEEEESSSGESELRRDKAGELGWDDADWNGGL